MSRIETGETTVPRRGVTVTRPSAAIWFTASRTGVMLTPERGRDLRRGDPLAGFELATEDPAKQPIVDLPLQRSRARGRRRWMRASSECRRLMYQTSGVTPANDRAWNERGPTRSRPEFVDLVDLRRAALRGDARRPDPCREGGREAVAVAAVQQSSGLEWLVVIDRSVISSSSSRGSPTRIVRSDASRSVAGTARTTTSARLGTTPARSRTVPYSDRLAKSTPFNAGSSRGCRTELSREMGTPSMNRTRSSSKTFDETTIRRSDASPAVAVRDLAASTFDVTT